MVTEIKSSIVKEADALLHSYLLEPDEAISNQLIVQLVCEHAEPIVKKVVSSRLGVDGTRLGNLRELHDAEDICNDVIVQLLKRLRRLKVDSGTEIVNDFSGYVAVTAYNACNLYLRKKYPERSRLKSRLRYVMRKDSRLAVWERSGRWVCGLGVWCEEERPLISTAIVRRLREDSEFVSRLATSLNGNQQKAASSIAMLFDRLAGPIELHVLAVLIWEAARNREQLAKMRSEIGSIEESDDEPLLRADESPDDWTLAEATRREHQTYLRRLWSEIRALPLRQRTALLLNLRDPLGFEVVTLLIDVGVASLADISGALDISIEQLGDLWQRLPIEDAKIAEQLGVSRQQVINLRLSARRRLARRMSSSRFI